MSDGAIDIAKLEEDTTQIRVGLREIFFMVQRRLKRVACSGEIPLLNVPKTEIVLYGCFCNIRINSL